MLLVIIRVSVNLFFVLAFCSWALDIWVSAFSSWALDSYRYRLRYLLGLWIGFHFKLILNRSGFHFGFWFPLRFLLNKWFSFGLYLMSRLILKLFG
ncbi:unnamed protein product [Rhizophagus irregularis]|nr:unnamed protein product [Rhizophagus irregularis]